MKSKTSFFNMTIFLKNIKRFWPVWASYTFIMFWVVTAVDFFNLSFSGMYTKSYIKARLVDTVMGTNISVGMGISIVIGLICAMCVFAYLQNEKSCNYIHSLPVTREGLFATNYLSGLSMMIIPNLLISILTFLMYISKGQNMLREISYWMLTVSVCDIFMYSIAVLIAVLTGSLIAVPVFYGIVHLYVFLILLPINGLMQYMYNGLNSDVLYIPDGVGGILFPGKFIFQMKFDTDMETGICKFSNYGLVMITIAVASVIMVALSVYLYRLRRSETAGDVMVFGFAKPLFRWVSGISFGLMLTILLIVTLFEDMYDTNVLSVIIIILLVVTSVVGFIGTEMIIRKSFRVFGRIRNELGIFGIVVLVAGILVATDFAGVENYTPKADQLEWVEVSTFNGTASFYDEKSAEYVIDLHKSILAEDHGIYGRYPLNIPVYQTFVIEYGLKNGHRVSRRYYITRDNQNVMNKIDQMYKDFQVNFILQYPEPVNLDSIEIIINRHDNVYFEQELRGANAIELFNAIKADISTGALTTDTCFNSSYSEDSDIYMSNIHSLDNKDIEVAEETYRYYDSVNKLTIFYNSTNGMYTFNRTIYYNDDCVNIKRVISKYSQKN